MNHQSSIKESVLHKVPPSKLTTPFLSTPHLLCFLVVILCLLVDLQYGILQSRTFRNLGTYELNETTMIWIYVILITCVVWLFCSALYLATEVTQPVKTFEYCRKMNQIVIVEWVSQAICAFIFIALGYVWFGVISVPVVIWHCVR